MSYWTDDAAFLRELADVEGMPDARRILDIAHDLDRAAPDGTFLEELAGKIERWSADRVAPTAEFADEIGEQLRMIALALKRDPSQ